MEYICETSKGSGQNARKVGEPYAIKFSDELRFVGKYGGNAEGVSITAVDRGGNVVGDYTTVIAVKDFLAIARSLKG